VAIVVASLLAAGLAAQAHAAPFHEQRSPSCTVVMGPGGGLQRFVDRLRPGSVGCLAPGKYAARRLVLRVSGTAAARITLTSLDPSRPAEIGGLLWLMDSANNWTISHLRLDGRNSRNLPSPQVNGDASVWLDDDVTNYREAGPTAGGGICFSLGSTDRYGYAVNTTIVRSRIHDCGVSDNANHGIYVAATTGSTIIRNNWIFRNGDRGIQLYPDARHVLIEQRDRRQWLRCHLLRSRIANLERHHRDQEHHQQLAQPLERRELVPRRDSSRKRQSRRCQLSLGEWSESRVPRERGPRAGGRLHGRGHERDPGAALPS